MKEEISFWNIFLNKDLFKACEEDRIFSLILVRLRRTLRRILSSKEFKSAQILYLPHKILFYKKCRLK
jgi:hypothetical protein